MNETRKSLEEAEKEATALLNEELDAHLNTSQFAYNLISLAINSFPMMKLSEVPNSLKVVVSLLVKISNDIRCVSLISSRGYPIQAAAIVASMYESSFMIAYVGNNEERAMRWIEHDNPKKLFINLYDLTKEAIKSLNVKDVDIVTEKEYLDYRQLCMVKHSNPLFQMEHGYRLEDNIFFAINGPEHSEESNRVSWFVLERSINYVLISLGSFINNHLVSYDIKGLVEGYQQLTKQYQTLNHLAIERWGTENPYPSDF